MTVRMVDDLTAPAWSATAQGVLNAVLLGIAPLLATPIGGWIFDHYSSNWVFIIGALLAVLAAVVIGVGVIWDVFKRESD